MLFLDFKILNLPLLNLVCTVGNEIQEFSPAIFNLSRGRLHEEHLHINFCKKSNSVKSATQPLEITSICDTEIDKIMCKY